MSAPKKKTVATAKKPAVAVPQKKPVAEAPKKAVAPILETPKVEEAVQTIPVPKGLATEIDQTPEVELPETEPNPTQEGPAIEEAPKVEEVSPAAVAKVSAPDPEVQEKTAAISPQVVADKLNIALRGYWGSLFTAAVVGQHVEIAHPFYKNLEPRVLDISPKMLADMLSQEGRKLGVILTSAYIGGKLQILF